MKLSLWTGKFRSTELFQFVAGWSVDLAQWVQEISDLTSQKDAYEGFRQEGGQVLREKGRIRPIARSSKLRSVRVGQIVHELRTDMLRDLLPLTLYGCTNTGHPRCDRSKSTDPGEDFRKAHILLQFACQYANHCVNELDRHSCKLERRSIEYYAKVNRLERHQHLLKEQKANLQRELEVLNCSLGGMQSLLQELDPGTLAQIEDT
ncbi:hypothetical protein PR002_g921 [Phytophthora rubi]|uniref:Uncharacterized protein n=1 Tax=Phytophthora rubi TaxID=129364 RepID=A0A6A3NSV8_9STRA|nr:hypothetical protein PR002_g921 [Phytophthora rubi]